MCWLTGDAKATTYLDPSAIIEFIRLARYSSKAPVVHVRACQEEMASSADVSHVAYMPDQPDALDDIQRVYARSSCCLLPILEVGSRNITIVLMDVGASFRRAR